MTFIFFLRVLRVGFSSKLSVNETTAVSLEANLYQSSWRLVRFSLKCQSSPQTSLLPRHPWVRGRWWLTFQTTDTSIPYYRHFIWSWRDQIWTTEPAYDEQSIWSRRDQNSCKLYLYNTGISFLRTVHLKQTSDITVPLFSLALQLENCKLNEAYL